MSRDRGAALLLVILLVALLAVLVTEFQRDARLEARTAQNLRDTLRVHALSRSGISTAAALLLEDDAALDTRLPDEDFWAADLPPFPVGEVLVEVDVQDLDGKFPLGALVDDQGAVPDARREAYEAFLFALSQHLKEAGLEQGDILDQVVIPDLVDALVDWIDANDRGNFEATEAPNAPLTHLDELYQIEAYRQVPVDYGHAVADAIVPYVDVRTGDTVNVNTAEPPVLAALHPDLDYAEAVEWYDRLSEEPAKGNVRLSDYPVLQGLKSADFVFQMGVASERFRVRLGIDVNGVFQKTEAVLVRDSRKKQVRTVQYREGLMRNYTFWVRRYQPEELPGGLFGSEQFFQ